jgi:alkaline phosphatase D
MKIAIASCSNPNNYPEQPVWGHVWRERPDALVLLGDTVYLDIPWVSTISDGMQHPQDVFATEFLKHGLNLYRAQLSRPAFADLVRNVPRSFAIWDDHDFLWNGAAGDAMSQNLYRDHFRATRALFRAFRAALAARDPQRFPMNASDPQLTVPYEPAPGYSAVDLIDGQVCLHLTDGRSFRNKHHLLGSSQRSQITIELQKRPQHVHLLASGIVFNGNKGERWAGFSEDYEWLKAMAMRHKIVVMSGDVHENRLPAPFPIPGGNDILEITSSGSAVGTLVAHGPQKHNFGIIAIDDGTLVLQTFHDADGRIDQGPAKFDVATWKSV